MTCQPQQQPTGSVELKINGRPIELNTFVESFICETILGMIKPLRDTGDVETITLQITKTQ